MLKEFLKTSEQELQDVIDGRKPAALGKWDNLPDGILSQTLFIVYGRFYDMAIAKTQENLNRVVSAYYIPLSLDADIELGKALGYDEKDIIEYTKDMVYPPVPPAITKQERTRLKIIAEIQKLGINKVVDCAITTLDLDKNSRHLIEKEDLDFDYAVKILLSMLKGGK